MEQKIFTNYVLEYTEDNITNLLDKNGKQTKFTYSFYSSNADFLDQFKNIGFWVKPKRTQQPKDRIIVDFETMEVSNGRTKEQPTTDELQMAIKIIKLALSNSNPEIIALKEEMQAKQKNLTLLKSLAKPDMDFAEEIATIENEIAELKAKINVILG